MPVYDIVVVGGGIAGLSAAYEAARRGFSVALLEARGLASGATGAASGIVSLQMPDPYQSWALESLRLYTRAMAARPVRAVLVADAGCVEGVRRLLAARGVPARLVGEEEASEALGAPVRAWRGAAILESVEYLVDVGAAVGYLRRALEERGAHILEGCRASLAGGGARCGPGEYKPRHALIVAAGAWTPALLRVNPEQLAGSRIYRCEASTASLDIRAILYVETRASAAYAAPEAPGRAIIGDGPNTPVPTPEDAHTPDPQTPYQVLETLSKATPQALHAYPHTTWAAPCILPGDGHPLAGPLTHNTYTLTGLNGHGLMTAPALAKTLLDQIEARKPPHPHLNPTRQTKPWQKKPPEPYTTCNNKNTQNQPL